MPDENNNPLPGEEGYVAPVETPEVPPTVEATPEVPVETPAPVVEYEDHSTPVPEETVPIGKYNQLLAAYTRLKIRVGLDQQYEKQLDAEAGL